MLELSFYKLVWFLKTYISPKKIETPIVIYLYIAQKWLGKLGYKDKDIRKDIFIDKYKEANIIKDHKNFLKRLEKLKLYILEFDKNSTMKSKIHPINCTRGNDR